MAERKRFVFIDLYNLHLAMSPVPTEYQETRTSFLGRDGKEKLIEFFKDHAPNLVKYSTAKEVRRRCTTPSGEIKVGLDEASSLGWYEFTFGVSWFESKHFLLLARQYQGLRKFVDEYLEEELSLESLLWLQRETFVRELCIFVKSPEGKVYRLPDRELSEKLKKIPLSEFEITLDWATTVVPGRLSDKIPFPYFGGIELKSLFFNIYDELADLLKDKYKIDRCAKPKCCNVFLKSRITHKYCSPRCRSWVSSTAFRRRFYTSSFTRDRNT